MTTFHLLLIIGTSVAWAMLDGLRRNLSRKLSNWTLVFYLALGPAPLVLVSTYGLPWVPPPPIYWLLATLIIGLNILANVFYVESVRRSPLSLTVPFLALTPALASLVAIPLLGERLHLMGQLGLGLVLVGAFILGLEGFRKEGEDHPFLRELGIPLMIAVACLWSLTPVLDKMALEYVDPRWHALILSLGIPLVVSFLLLARRGPQGFRLDRSILPILVLAIVVHTGALLLQLITIIRVDVAVVETAKRGLGTLAAVLMGAYFFHEEIPSRRAVAAGIMVVGVILLFL